MDIKNVKSKHKTSLVSLIIFLITLGVVLFSLLSVVFPALMMRTLSVIDDNSGINPFEPGIWAYPLLITNFIIFGLMLLYYKKKLPTIITKSIKFIFNYEISSKLAFFVIVIIIGVYITTSIGELFNGEFSSDYHFRGKAQLENYDVTTIGEAGLGSHFGHFLTTSSMYIFGNYKVIPFIASIALLVLTYFFTFEISKKRFA